MKINNIYKPLLLVMLLLFVVVGCSEDDNLTLPSHSVIDHSHRLVNYTAQVNQEMSFVDLGQGVVSRNWRLTDTLGVEGVSALVLKLDKDLDDPQATRRIIANSDNSYTQEEVLAALNEISIGDETVIPEFKDPILKMSFDEPGTFDVTLTHEFADNPFVANDTIRADSNVVERTFRVTILDRLGFSNIEGFILNNDGTLGDALTIQNGALNDVIAGSTVRFTFDILGGGETLSAESGNGNVIDGSAIVNLDGTGSIDIKYGSLDTYDLTLITNRAEPDATRRMLISDVINVIPSTEPVTLDNQEINNGAINLVFSREIDAASINAGDFTVTLVDKNGTDIPVTIDNITTDSNDGSIVSITLDGEFAYDDDTATVSYTKGTLATTDAVLSDSFSGIQIPGTGFNIHEANSFDIGAENWTEDAGRNGSVTFVDPAPVAIPSGASRVGYILDGGGDKSHMVGIDTYNLQTSKSYVLKYKYYTLSGHTGDSKLFIDSRDAAGLVTGSLDLTSSIPAGTNWAGPSETWNQIEVPFIVSADGDITIRIQSKPASLTDVYIDDVQLLEKNLRP